MHVGGGMGGFPEAPSTSQTPDGCPVMQLDSDAAYMEEASNPTGEGLSPARSPQLQASVVSPGCHLYF